ncbi:MAG: NAD(P)/FAD-dependent oxidoreductase [Proteobacteria bacterium]|nr:NAD(P)/FAD-dependent oxidoreductase [Pseudomonadota bacterium]
MESLDCIVVGAGVVGLAIARSLALAGREVVVLEKEDSAGTGISSRNSEVIHAGMYYSAGSLKAQLCVAGNAMLRAYAASRNVPFKMVGKLIAATSKHEESALGEILVRGRENGAQGLTAVSLSEVRALEPQLHCTAALFSPNTGIIDSHALMMSFQADLESHGGVVAFQSPALSGVAREDGVELDVGGSQPMRTRARTLVIASGLAACPLARAIGLRGVPQERLCKGNYFGLTGKSPFQHLVYPVPVAGGLGTHYTLDLAGRGRFGPDVEWIDREDYLVDPARSDSFYAAIRRYWPDLRDGALEPAYAGIRPKIADANGVLNDFRIDGPRDHGAPGVVALYGIESPGLTCSLAIAERVKDLVS